MSEPIIIDTPSGDQLVILPRTDYDAMRARLADYEAGEDAADIAAGERGRSEWEAQGRPAYPLPVVRLIRDGHSPFGAFRRYRKVTRKALAKQTGIEASALGDFENGRKTPDARTLDTLALALETNAASLKPFDLT